MRAPWARRVCHIGAQDSGCLWGNFLRVGTGDALAWLWRGVRQPRNFSAPIPPGGACTACECPAVAPVCVWLSQSQGNAGRGWLQGHRLGSQEAQGSNRAGLGRSSCWGQLRAQGDPARLGLARDGVGRPVLGPVSWAVLLGCTGPPTFLADTAPFSRLCHLFSPRSLSLFAFPFTTWVPTSVGTLGEAGKRMPMARFVLRQRT